MVKGLYTAYTGMINEQHRMDVLANNLANAATNGYKKEGTTSESFKTVFADKIKDTSEAPNTARRIGTMMPGVKIGDNYTDYSEGPIKTTGNPYDLALTGKGFFAVEYKNKAGDTSTKYTRDGNFTVTSDGYLTTQDGDYVLDDNGRHIKLDTAKDSSIASNGSIYQDGSQVATIQIADFDDYTKLEKFGENYYQPKDADTTKATAAEGTEVRQGYLETSNISVVTEMVSMIAIQRQYEANQKLITTFDSSLDKTVNDLGRI
jgi:flagellar basal-body rod protein FlgF